FCVHPICQSDRHLRRALTGEIKLAHLTGDVVALAMEYRRVANAYISTMKVRRGGAIALSPLDEVNAMLAADKVQNFKDFRLHICREFNGAPDRVSARYIAYFESWLERLGVDPTVFQQIAGELEACAGGDRGIGRPSPRPL
ncbi:MAG: hypothetical protein AAFY88_27700, partial [Acidobacteriota bacterium]